MIIYDKTTLIFNQVLISSYYVSNYIDKRCDKINSRCTISYGMVYNIIGVLHNIMIEQSEICG